MINHRILCSAIPWAFVLSISTAAAQGGAAGGMYQIISGTYIECCGIAGEFHYPLPSESQRFVRLTVDTQRDLAMLTFLGKDMRTVLSIEPCPPGDPIPFSFEDGFILPNGIEFHVDPGPPPYGVYWFYTVSNSADGLCIQGTQGMALQNCADFPTQFSHRDVVAVPVPGPRLRITEFSKEGALLFIQGQAGWTNVIEASMDLAHWTPIHTNVMPATLCPICPYLLYQDTASTNLPRRFYRCFEFP